MKISGSGTIPQGDFNEDLNINGAGKLLGNVKCNSLSACGVINSQGNCVCAENFSVSGRLKSEGFVKAKNIKVFGSVDTAGEIACEQELKLSGSLTPKGGIKAGVVNASGTINSGADIEAEEFHFSGNINCTGLLNAEKIDIKLDKDDSEIESIGGSEISIGAKGRLKKISKIPLVSKLFKNLTVLTVNECIEGDSINLEYVKAKRVVGRDVRIGVGCEIDEVKYTESYLISPDAKVGACEKVGK